MKSSASRNTGVRRWRGQRPALGAAAILVAVGVAPASALAGKTVYAGNQSLKVTASFTPNRAGTRGAALKVHIDYESTRPGQRIGGTTQQIQLQFPENSSFNGSNVTQCPYASLTKATNSQVAGVCPKASVIGTGTFTADARPLLAQPVSGTLTLYNVRGQHNDVLLVGHTSFGYFSYFFVNYNQDNDNDNDNDPVLQADFNNHGGASLYNLKIVDFTLKGGTNAKPLIRLPASCRKGGWLMGLSIASYGGPPPIEATDSVACTKVTRRHRKR